MYTQRKAKIEKIVICNMKSYFGVAGIHAWNTTKYKLRIRAIDHDNKLEILECLVKTGSNSLPELAIVNVSSKYNGDKWVHVEIDRAGLLNYISGEIEKGGIDFKLRKAVDKSVNIV